MGIRGRLSRNTLANANSVRDWRSDIPTSPIYSSNKARELYRYDDFSLAVAGNVYAFDATTIDLCLSLFPWAKFRKRKGAVKLHTLLDLRGNIPTVIIITHGLIHEVNILEELTFEAGAFYLMDRAYLDFPRLHRLHLASAFFVTRARKRSIAAALLFAGRPHTGIMCDQIVTDQPSPTPGFPTVRRIRFFDTQQERRLVFLTNNLPAPLTVAQLYRSRWRWSCSSNGSSSISVRKFYGTSENALKTNLDRLPFMSWWPCQKQLKLEGSLYRILQS